MKDLTGFKILVIDYGTNISVAIRLARDFGTVFYWSGPYVTNGFPEHSPLDVGHNVPNIVKVREWAEVYEEADAVMFTESMEPYLQNWMKNNGKPVFGSVFADKLEHNRLFIKETLKELGLPVGPYSVAHGLDELEQLLQNSPGGYVKNCLRGNGETWKHKDWRLSKRQIIKLRHKMGLYENRETYILDHELEPLIEFGYDGFIVGGEYVPISQCGIEVKNCYDDSTEVLTNEGWKFFKDLNRKEKILTMNISDVRHISFEYELPTDYIESDYNGKMINIEKEGVSICVTPGHNILVQDGIQNEDGEVLKWESLGEGNNVNVFKRGKRVLRLQKMSDLIKRNKRFSMLQPKGRFLPEAPSKERIKIGDNLISKSHFAKFMGIYLSEGYCRKRTGKKGKDRYEIMIAQEKYVNEFETVLKLLPFGYKKVSNGFYLYDNDLGEYCHKFGNAREKYVPDWIKNSGQKIIDEFLYCFCLGDGSFIKNYKSVRKDSPAGKLGIKNKEIISRWFHTSSIKMANDLQELLVKLGSVAVLYNAKEYFNKRENITCQMYVVREKNINRKNYVFPEDISYVDYDRKVYCVTVPNGIIMTRRNGKSLWCGNCCYIGKFIRYQFLPEQIRLINDKLAPLFKEMGYNGHYSNEIILSKDKRGFLLDNTCRMPSPPGELMQEAYTNYSEIIWDIAHGKMPVIEYEHEWGAQLIIKSSIAEHDPSPILIPDEFKKYVKIKNLSIDEDGTWYYVPYLGADMEEMGVVVYTGDSEEEVIEGIKEVAKSIEGFDVRIDISSLDDAKKALQKAKKHGINYI